MHTHRDAIVPEALDRLDLPFVLPVGSGRPRMFLRGQADARDWDAARRVVVKMEDSETAEHDVRIVARALAKARTRGQRDALAALGHDTSHLYEAERPPRETA